MIHLRENERIEGINAPTVEYDNLSLVAWNKPLDGGPWGYYASFRIGAEWIDEKNAIVVTTKRGMEGIDFLSMFMTCFSSDLEIESFSKIYTIETDQPAIDAPSLRGVVSPLIVLHFLGIIGRIKTLKKGYVHCCENLKKVKGHIVVLKNERTNIAMKRYDRIYCEYDDYSSDIPENRILKKALLFSQRLIMGIGESHPSFQIIKHRLAKCLTMFQNVSDEVDYRDIRLIKENKIYKDYAEAIRLAKLVLSHFDYSINKVNNENNKVVPFVIDMSRLYEHYVYGLLHEAYNTRITYQFIGKTGRPDFLYRSNGFKAILDTKYIPKYDHTPLDTHVVRQLSGYSRDIPILRYLGYNDITEESPIPSVPCIIIYPIEAKVSGNPFLGKSLINLCSNKVKRLSRFYKISIPLPLIN